MRIASAVTVAFVALSPFSARPEVADSSPAGFTVKISTRIQAAPDEVYRRFLRVGEWWSSEHSWSGDSRNLSIDPKPGGCFCEQLPNGGGVRHMEVIYVAPGRKVALTGALGPLQSIATGGNMAIQFSPDGSGTSLALTYAVFGYLPAGMNTWAGPVDSVLSSQIARLKNYVEKGNPAPK